MGSLLSGFALSFCEEGETPGGEVGVITGSEGSLDSLPLLANPSFLRKMAQLYQKAILLQV